jgi:hypothetical protein
LGFQKLLGVLITPTPTGFVKTLRRCYVRYGFISTDKETDPERLSDWFKVTWLVGGESSSQTESFGPTTQLAPSK